ncbi:hypothetical protein NST04_24590 [Paenibacillus sp. FSL H7-0756]|uniref:hypothetical protein n=1 Tax=unclassified Paenibacillus TaxID=185978 RepID=UPI0030FA8D43
MNPAAELPVLEKITEHIDRMEAIIDEIQIYGEIMPCIGSNAEQIKALLRLLKIECEDF